MDIERAVKIMSRTWGVDRKSNEDEEYWVAFSTARGDAKDKRDRIMSWADHYFLWPRDKAKVKQFLKDNQHNELYWCPSMFEIGRRQSEVAWEERALWADLDEVDPKAIKDYPPTIAWESSPGRYQAIWIVRGGDMLHASSEGGENHRLTYHLGADKSGWDTTQLLRVPGSTNYKPEYRNQNGGKGVEGKILWDRGRDWFRDDWDNLPKIEALGGIESDVLEEEVDNIDRHAVWARVRLKVSSRVREFIAAREASGDRSDILWEIERELADAGCTVAEIVAIIRPSVWNKYVGRADEFRRLQTEAIKAVSQKDKDDPKKTDSGDALEVVDDSPKPDPVNIFEFVKNLKPAKWLIRGVLTEGAVGFIAGQPKQFKSWFALDMALSVGSGQPFLGHFDVVEPGPVLYIQEEDSGPLIKNRLNKVWPGKLSDKIVMEDGEIYWQPGQESDIPDVDAYIRQSFIVSDPGWQSWLDEQLGKKRYRLVVLDPLMMMAGEVEENRAQEMTTKVFKPLKDLAQKHGCAIQFVHHMRKGDPKNPQRGGQMMLGSVANHAWAEDSMYLKYGRGGLIVVEQESKNAPVFGFNVAGLRNRSWTPRVTLNAVDNGDSPAGDEGSVGKRPRKSGGDESTRTPAAPRPSKAIAALAELGPGAHKMSVIRETAHISLAGVSQALDRAKEKGWVEKIGPDFSLTEKGRRLFS